MSYIPRTTLGVGVGVGVGGAALALVLGIGLTARTPTGPTASIGVSPPAVRLPAPATLPAAPASASTAPTPAPPAATATPVEAMRGGWIALGSYSLMPGTLALAIDGGGFAADETVDLQAQGAGAQAAATLRADAAGRIDGVVRLRVAPDRAGALRLTALGRPSGRTATADLGVLPYVPVLALQPYAARPGEAVRVRGRGFAPDEAVRLTLGSATLATLRADASGAFGPTIAYTVPYAASDHHPILMATGAASRRAAWQRLTVVPPRPWATASAYVVRPGDSVSFDAHGFAAGEDVIVYGRGVALYRGATPTDEGGDVSGLGPAPVVKAKGDEHPVYTLVGTRSRARVTVTLAASRP